jgi:hypothetical protein
MNRVARYSRFELDRRISISCCTAFLSHSRRDNAAAQALFRWLTQAEPSLRGEIFLDVNPQTGFAPGARR